MTISTQLTMWPTTKPLLCKILGLDSEADKCHGLIADGTRRCKLGLSKLNKARISSLLEQIVVQGSLKAVRSILEQLSNLVFCPHIHREKYSKDFLSQWEEKLEKTEDSTIVKKEEEDNKASLSDIESHTEKAGISSQSNPVLSVPQIKVEDKDASNNEALQDTTSVGVKTQSRRISASSVTIPEAPEAAALRATGPKHDFERYSAEKSLLEINTKMKEYVRRALSQEEKNNRAVKGVLYTYAFPNHYRDAHPYLKIGFTKEPERRMADWDRKCGYKPEEISHHTAENYARVERLVHIQLANLRMKEYNGCPGCTQKHQEWFNVRSTRASEVISLWCDWMRLTPYDEDGKLTQYWVDRLEAADLTNPRCWNFFVNGPDASSSGSESEFESESDSENESGCESEFFDLTV